MVDSTTPIGGPDYLPPRLPGVYADLNQAANEEVIRAYTENRAPNLTQFVHLGASVESVLAVQEAFRADVLDTSTLAGYTSGTKNDADEVTLGIGFNPDKVPDPNEPIDPTKESNDGGVTSVSLPPVVLRTPRRDPALAKLVKNNDVELQNDVTLNSGFHDGSPQTYLYPVESFNPVTDLIEDAPSTPTSDLPDAPVNDGDSADGAPTESPEDVSAGQGPADSPAPAAKPARKPRSKPVTQVPAAPTPRRPSPRPTRNAE